MCKNTISLTVFLFVYHSHIFHVSGSGSTAAAATVSVQQKRCDAPVSFLAFHNHRVCEKMSTLIIFERRNNENRTNQLKWYLTYGP